MYSHILICDFEVHLFSFFAFEGMFVIAAFKTVPRSFFNGTTGAK
jgi:hypothetical protein